MAREQFIIRIKGGNDALDCWYVGRTEPVYEDFFHGNHKWIVGTSVRTEKVKVKEVATALSKAKKWTSFEKAASVASKLVDKNYSIVVISVEEESSRMRKIMDALLTQ